MIYGIITFFICVFSAFFGEAAKSVSTIFSLGNKGLTVSTHVQFLLVIALIMLLRFVFMTDCVIKKMALVLRVILMLLSVLGVIIGFVFGFGWFPITEIRAWGMFALCFVVSCIASTIISVLAERQENRKLEDALRRFKEEQ